MTVNDRPARSAAAAPGARISPPLARSLSTPDTRLQRRVLTGVGLAALVSLPWNQRAREHAIMLAIGLAAVAGLAREAETHSLARLIAWDHRRYQRYLRTLKENRP